MEKISIQYKIRHGSSDSIDKDYFYVVESLPTSKYWIEYKKSCANDINFITITDGIVSGCMTGTVDEINNGILYTYNIHKENITNKCPITSPVPRNKIIKLFRCIRYILSILSRTKYRSDVKCLLKSTNIFKKLEFLKNIELYNITEFNKKQSIIDIYKNIAFQIGQTILLLYDIEVYTKHDIVKYIPVLEEYLYRIDLNSVCLSVELNMFTEEVIEMLSNGDFFIDNGYFMCYDECINIKIV